MKLDRQSPVPLHVQAEQLLRDLVLQGEYRDGGLLPDELTLANRLGISRGTLRAAIGRLVQQGLLERRAGFGTRVRQRAVESGIGAWRSFSQEMARKGIQVENFLLDFKLTPAGQKAARALNLESPLKLWRLDRVRGWKDRPVLHSRSWFHPRLKLTGKEDFSRPLYELLRSETGAEAHYAHEEFHAVAAPAATARVLRVQRGHPLLLRSHTVFDVGGRPIEFAEIHYVSSRFALTLEVRREEERKP